MKDFIKWLGVNEKVAKVAVWLLIIMVTLIIFNTAMESLGFPYYAITYDNLVKISASKVMNIIIAILISLLNFYSTILLVLRVKEAKPIFKYAVLYLVLNSLFIGSVSKELVSVFVVLYVTILCYFYSGKNWKYIIYSLLAFLITAVVQEIWFLSKVRFIDYTKLDYMTKSILSFDYFIIIGLIILVKEIYLKKRSEKNVWNTRMLPMDRGIQKRKQVRKETSKKNSKRK